MKAIIPSSSGFSGGSDQDRPVNHEKADPCQEFFCSFPQFSSVHKFFPFSQAASVATLPSALLFERFSLGASWVFFIQQVLLSSPRPLLPSFVKEVGRDSTRSHLKLGGRARLSGTNSLRCCADHLLAIAQRFVNLSTDPQPM